MVYFSSSNENLCERTMSLETAPKHIQLAVDLIEILEANKVDNITAVEALKIVLNDYQAKLVSNSKADDNL